MLPNEKGLHELNGVVEDFLLHPSRTLTIDQMRDIVTWRNQLKNYIATLSYETPKRLAMNFERYSKLYIMALGASVIISKESQIGLMKTNDDMTSDAIYVVVSTLADVTTRLGSVLV